MKKISLSRNELIAQIPTSFTAIGNRVVSADNSTIANFRLGTNNTQDEAEVYAQMFALMPEMKQALSNLVDWCIQFTPEYPACLVRAKELI